MFETGTVSHKKCEQCGERAAFVAIGVNTLLTVLKFVVGFYSGSRALFADGLHSAANIVTAATIVFSHRVGKKPSTYRYPYGYGKVEFVAAGGISLFITVGAIVLISVSIRHLLQPTPMAPDFSAILMAIISIGANEMLFRYMRCAGTQLKSPTIIARRPSIRVKPRGYPCRLTTVPGAHMLAHQRLCG
ncbi:MAG: cation diffusion facilitator family transporter [Desulfobacterales bacterium]